jgi:hypothetical protein
VTDPLPQDAEILTGSADYAARATRMISESRNDLALLTQELDRRIYGTEVFSESLRRFALGNQHARARILVNSTQVAIANSPRLVEFGRTLSTFIEFRELLPERRQFTREEYLVADGRLLLHRESPNQLEAKYYGNAAHVARLKLKDFDMLWQESTTAQELRRLNL